jgi:NADPH-dependent 2,4-dienoyl-CoA reductase/sulfur reductase-like enzyme/pSer/pThr/pTyr-binding forkhead associated (FHA) protein
MTEEYVVIGNGIAGVTAAGILRAEDGSAEITVIADDPFPVYYRPALKDYLAGRVREDKLWARPASFYQDQRIRFLSERVTGIQAGRHLVHLQSGHQVGYSRLLLACGARASRLNCPGVDLAGVTTLRTVADYQALQQRLPLAKHIVVSGSGTLALETIETLRHRGYRVTHLVRRRTLWSEILDLTASDLVIQQERRDGVDVRVEEEIAEITGRDGQVSGVVTTGGARIACELVLIAIGVEPVTGFIKSSGIPCERGVRVDQAMRTAAPDIYAAGDVLETMDAASGRRRVIGQWYPAVQQARAAAYSMLGLLDASQPFQSSTFYNATFLYGLDFASVGLTQMPGDARGYQEIVADPRPRVYRKVLLKAGVPVGMLMLGDRTGALAFKRAIDHKVDLMSVAERLFASDFKLSDWLDQQGVPPAIPGVSREGDGAARQVVSAGTAPRKVVSRPERAGEAFLLLAAMPAENRPAGPRAEKIPLSATSVTTVGRQAGVSLLIDHASVSRRHAEISCADGQYVVRDLGSSNGTFVREQRLEPGSAHHLQPGDQIRFGKVSYRFQMEQAEKAASRDSQATIINKTRLIERATGFFDPAAADQIPAASAQPLLKADGSLLLPGAREAIPARDVAALKSTPALIALLHGRPRIVPLRPGKTISLGRYKANEIVLPDMSASRKHAEIFRGADGFYVRDLESSNGVMVNSTRIEGPYRLAHGDRLLIGGTTLYFMYQLSSAPEEAASPGSGPQAPLTCRRCGTPVQESARFCGLCGAFLEQQRAAVKV